MAGTNQREHYADCSLNFDEMHLQCRCTWRYEGRRCDNAKQVRFPQFHGTSYLSYALSDQQAKTGTTPGETGQLLEVRLEFTTTAQLGLVSYIHRFAKLPYFLVSYTKYS